MLVEVARTSRDYAELSGRSQPVIGDVVVSLINLGITLDGITTYGRRENRPIIPAPQQISAQKQISLLQAGTKLSHPPHIPHHLPPLPDPHAYIRTPVINMKNKNKDFVWVARFYYKNLFQTHKQPVTEYEAIREKAASQKRDVEKALTRFLAKTSETHCLFASEDNQMFPCTEQKTKIILFYFILKNISFKW